jgi:hypothetical protein
MAKALTAEQFWCIALARPKSLERPQWIRQQTKIQATETAAMADDWTSAIAAVSG